MVREDTNHGYGGGMAYLCWCYSHTRNMSTKPVSLFGLGCFFEDMHPVHAPDFEYLACFVPFYLFFNIGQHGAPRYPA